MNIDLKLILASLLFLMPMYSFADHPGEGQITIKNLTQEALENNLEIRARLKKIEVSEMLEKSLRSGFYPKLSLEAGPQISRIENNKKTGMALYGKAEWNLYRGGSELIKSKRASEELERSKRYKDSFKNEVKSRVAQLYYELQFASESKALLEQALQLNDQQKKIAVKKNQAGFTSSSDVLEFELREATLKSDLLFTDQKLNDVSRQLGTLLSRPSESGMIAVKGHLERKDFKVDRAKLIETLKQNNDVLASVESEKKIASLEKQEIESSFRPQINIEGLYGRLGNEEEVYQDKNNFALLLKVSVPLFSGLETFYGAKAAKARIESMSFAGEQSHIETVSELDQSFSKIIILGKRLDLEEANLARSMKYYESTFKEYKLGQKNSPDMVGASERVIDARLRNLEYRRDALIERVSLSRLIGKNVDEL